MLTRLLAWLTFRELCPCSGCNGTMRERLHVGKREPYYECTLCRYNTLHKECSP